MKQKLFTFFFALVASISAIYAQSGTCGSNLTWMLDAETGVLTISGTGAMDNYYYGREGNKVSPWNDFTSVIKTVIINDGVTSIGEYAFRGCSSLTSVTIGESVTSIGDDAFSDCRKLTSVTIGESVTSIGKCAFWYCSSLTSVTIGESVTSIGNQAFDQCTSLTSVTINSDAIVNKQYSQSSNLSHIFGSQVTEYVIGDNVTSIGVSAFEDCSSLTSVTIGESVTSIGGSAFSGCSSLTSITIPESVTSIGNWAFASCSSLTSITIPNSVTSIGVGAFSGCSSLTSITIPNSVTSIGGAAFYDCSSLTSMTIGESVTSIGDEAFWYCSSLTSVTINSDAIVNKQYSRSSNLSHIFGSQVTEYVIGDNVIGIGGSAFSGCSSLTSVTIPNSVTSIGGSAFSGCSSLEYITIPESVTSIGGYAFSGCSSLEYITIPESVTSIGESAFYGCSSLEYITIPESVTSIGNYAFQKCSSLTSVTIGESVTSIGGYAFDGCSSLEYITIPESVTSIGENAFRNCSSLTSITIPNSVTSIGEGAFKGCSYLISITIPNSVTSIGWYAFRDCSSLTSVHITDLAAWCNIDFADYRANPLSSAHNLYLNGELVKDLVIPNSVTSIGEYAFYACSSLTSVTIGNSVTSIGEYAFYNCSSLTSITCEAVTPPTIGGTYTFDGVSKSIPVYVPCECVEAYKAASGWSDFTNIQVPLAEYSIEVYVNNTIMGTAKVNYNNFCEGNQISATPNFGYHFVQWSDGNTENPRTLELTQDTILTAEFAQSFSGQCGDSLYWELVDTTLHITGKGEMYNYKYNTIPWKLLVSSIKVLTIAEDVTKLSQSFDSCSVLESIVWNAKHAADTYSDGQYVYPIFYGIRSQITSFTFGEAVEYIPAYLCDGMDKLTSMTIPNSVTSIGWYAFSGCSSLTSITIPNSVTSIGDDVFRDCSSLTSVTIPNSVTSIGWYAFSGCSSLTSITIPNSVTSIGDDAFYGCSNITSVTWNAKNCNTYNFGSQVTSFEFGNEVEVVPSSLCMGMDKLTSVTIPNSVTSIRNSAFSGCSSLTSITIPDSVTSIGNYAFASCSSLTSVTIGNSVTSIGGYAFSGCSSLTSPVYNAHCFAYMPTSYSGAYTIPEGIKQIAGGAFYNCSSLTSITIPDSVTSIGKSAFEGCSAIDSIVWNAKNCADASASEDAPFYAICSQITSFTFGENVEHIPAYLCDGMDKLTSVTIPNSMTSIGDAAFWGCSSLTSVTIPNSVTSIGDAAFRDCSSLTSVTIPNSVTSIGGAAFDGCSSLTSVTIGNSVTSIGSSAFSGCSSLTSVTIGNSVTSIGNYAFYNCSSLTSITCEAATPPTIETYINGNTYTFDGVSTSIPVYVPCGCVEAYKAASGWSDFTNIQVPLLKYSIEVYVNDTIMGTAKVNYNTFCEGAQISATPNFGYHFVQWSDGNTDNPRTLELTQDTILIAEFAQSFSGQCGDSLYWELVDTTLHITGKGEMYNYKSNTIPWKLLVSSIKVLTIVEDVTKLSQSFDSCSVLESIVWNAKNCADASSLETAPFYAIRSQITSFTFGEAVEYIPAYLCDGMDKLTSMTIPNSVTSIGSSAFYNCSSLTSVHITDLAAWCNIDFVGYSANPLCYAHKLYLNGELVKDLVIPNSVTSIGEYAFYDCSSLTSVTIPESVTSIGKSAFEGCASLTSITIPNSVTSIGDWAFDGCNNITSVTWNAKNCNAYNFGSQVTSFEFGNEVEVVPSSLCKGMEKLTSVTIPNSVKTIGTSAFEGCARLGKISLGTGLEDIAANAFAGCTRLYDIYVYATYPPFAEESSFANYNVYVYVPCEYLRDYTLDIVWGKFKFIECIDSKDATTDGNVTVVPGYNDVTITWPTAENADTYSLVINKDNQPFCTLTFNQEGQLLNIAFAPSRDGNNRPAQYAEQAVNGYRFTVTGLTEATQYAYNITTKDAANKTIATYSGEFTTMGDTTTDMDNIQSPMTNCQKILRNGQLLIIRDGVEYNAMGQEL